MGVPTILEPNQRKILRKTQKDDNLLKTKRRLKPKYKLGGGMVFTFSRPGESNHPSSLQSRRHRVALVGLASPNKASNPPN